MNALSINKVSVVFGQAPAAALMLADQGASRAEIAARSGQVLAVQDCSLEVGLGEIVVLMGLSGSGKSTLLRTINALAPVARGDVELTLPQGRVNVTKAKGATLRHIRQHGAAMVFQQFDLLPWRSVADNVGFALELQGIDARARKGRIAEQLALVGLSDWARRNVGELSGGMQQRVGLARALATEAPILLMDEPFSALDPLIRAKLQDDLLALQARLKRTILFVSHDLDEAFKLGNRIAIMDHGRIVQCGAPQEIIAAPANAHVAEFVAHMNPIAVLRARDVMETGRAGDATIAIDAPLRVVLRALTHSEELAVIDAGRPVGRITAQSVVARLARSTA